MQKSHTAVHLSQHEGGKPQSFGKADRFVMKTSSTGKNIAPNSYNTIYVPKTSLYNAPRQVFDHSERKIDIVKFAAKNEILHKKGIH